MTTPADLQRQHRTLCAEATLHPTTTARDELFAIETRLAAAGHPAPLRSIRIY